MPLTRIGLLLFETTKNHGGGGFAMSYRYWLTGDWHGELLARWLCGWDCAGSDDCSRAVGQAAGETNSAPPP